MKLSKHVAWMELWLLDLGVGWGCEFSKQDSEVGN